MNTFDFTTGTTPLLLSMPHSGTLVPEGIAATMTPAGREVSDTDWHVGALYEFVGSLGVSVIRSRYSRYVIDLNRPPMMTTISILALPWARKHST